MQHCNEIFFPLFLNFLLGSPSHRWCVHSHSRSDFYSNTSLRRVHHQGLHSTQCSGKYKTTNSIYRWVCEELKINCYALYLLFCYDIFSFPGANKVYHILSYFILSCFFWYSTIFRMVFLCVIISMFHQYHISLWSPVCCPMLLDNLQTCTW